VDDVPAVLAGTSPLGIGPIADHPSSPASSASPSRAGKTRPLNLGDYAASGGWAGLRKAHDIGAEATIAEVTASGLRGRGGAGFPAGIKWTTVAKAKAAQNTSSATPTRATAAPLPTAW
jgi:formate dehydrogenase iron-sulfur subunit